MARKLETIGHAAFKVTFKKQVATNDVADGLDGADVSTQAKRRKVIKQLMEGAERVMHARMARTADDDSALELGRYKVLDLDELFKHNDEKRAMRLVDTRTITELVVDNVRYYV